MLGADMGPVAQAPLGLATVAMSGLGFLSSSLSLPCVSP